MDEDTIREEAMRLMVRAIESAIPAQAPFHERLEAALAGELELLGPLRPALAPLFRREPALGATRLTALYRGLVTRAVASGEISRFVDVETAVAALWAFRGRVIAYWVDDESPDAEDTRAQIHDGVSFLVRRWGGAT